MRVNTFHSCSSTHARGWSAHLCGAFMRNRQRRVGLLDEEENEDLEATTKIAACNSETEEWVAGLVVQ